MKAHLYKYLISVILFLSLPVYSQTIHDVELINFSFSPAQLTIETGDTVRWTNKGGLHDVLSDDNLFSSGSPSNSNWVYEFVFNAEGTFHYYCSLHGGAGGVGMSGVITVVAPTDVEDQKLSETSFELSQNYPNPFNPTTTIKYSIPSNVKGETSNVKLIIFDILGREVITLINQTQKPGNYEVEWEASSYPSGIYFYKIIAGNFTQIKKMVLLK